MFNVTKIVNALALGLALTAITGCAENACPSRPRMAASGPEVRPSPEVTAPELVGAWYQIYFDNDKAEISQRGRVIVTNVAYVVANNDRTRVTVIGKTDTVGSASENMALSKHRANQVRDALIAAGVPVGRIDTRWTGRGMQDYPTGGGVVEPLDRVVDIIVVKDEQ